jgi:hypothetical protein
MLKDLKDFKTFCAKTDETFHLDTLISSALHKTH